MGFSRIKECLDLVIFFLSSISLQLSPTSLSPLFLHFYVCACSVRAGVSPKITLRYPRNQTTNDNIIAQAFQNTTHKKVCCSYINLQQPPNRPLWVLYLSASSPLSLLSFSLLGCHISTTLPTLLAPHPTPHSASLRASVEIRSSLSEVLCHVAQGAWNSPRAVEQTQAQRLSIAAPQTNCLSNEPPSLSCPHTHTHVCVHCDIHAHTLPLTEPIWFKE